MSYKVRIDSFEGPFDLLLYLVSRQKVDIGAISITEIADQYLAEVSRMETLDLDVASDFLLVASTLLEIKAQSLIPRERDELDDDLAELAPSEARDMLVERLMEYKKFKNAAAVLHNRFIAEGRMHTRPFGPDADFLGLMPDFLEGVSLDALAYQAAAALARREVFLLESEHIAAKPIPVEVHVRAIHQLHRRPSTCVLAACGPGHPQGCGGSDVSGHPRAVQARHGEARAGRAVRRYRDRLHREFGRFAFGRRRRPHVGGGGVEAHVSRIAGRPAGRAPWRRCSS